MPDYVLRVTVPGNSTYPVYNASSNNDIYTGGGDLASMILAGHNRVRADVGVAPLVWNDSLAASAQTWADHLAATNRFYHDPDPNRTWGESISAHGGVSPDVPMAQMQEFFFSEMNNYHGQTEGSESVVAGHYTQSVWNSTTSVGCATASNADAGLSGVSLQPARELLWADTVLGESLIPITVSTQLAHCGSAATEQISAGALQSYTN